ncbi:hypothetical protein D3X11_01645 [Streptococcus sp. X16XC17]|uniref:hypothetical protein n=1 Tax=unclassified Streptococcus TaxID=2608887 RepID=UPI00066FBA8F|nr:hypothetical protein [Streptococcus sp. X13SY08]TCD46186.1 hypothetical protein D3X11_01645 [Streptococcus sp. X16XC17]
MPLDEEKTVEQGTPGKIELTTTDNGDVTETRVDPTPTTQEVGTPPSNEQIQTTEPAKTEYELDVNTPYGQDVTIEGHDGGTSTSTVYKIETVTDDALLSSSY